MFFLLGIWSCEGSVECKGVEFWFVPAVPGALVCRDDLFRHGGVAKVFWFWARACCGEEGYVEGYVVDLREGFGGWGNECDIGVVNRSGEDDVGVCERGGR